MLRKRGQGVLLHVGGGLLLAKCNPPPPGVESRSLLPQRL